jgi:hypothetical protein
MFEQLGTTIDGLDILVDSDALAAAVALRDRLEARISDAVAAYDQTSLWEVEGATSMTAWLTDRARMPRPRAAATASRARKLTQLPVTANAWRTGILSSGQVEAIAANLDADTVGLFADHEAAVVPTLVDLSARDVGTAMRAWREAATADRDPKPEPPQALHLSPTLAGRWRLDANLRAETGELLSTALRLAQTPDSDAETVRSPPHGGPTPWGTSAASFSITNTSTPVAATAPTSTSSSTSSATSPWAASAPPAPTAPPSTGPRWSGCCATVPCTGSSPPGGPPSSTTAGPPAPSPLRCSTPWSYAMNIAGSRAATAPPAGAKATTSASGNTAAPPPSRTSSCSAARHHHLLHKPRWHAKLLPDATLEVTDPRGHIRTTTPPSGRPPPLANRCRDR